MEWSEFIKIFGQPFSLEFISDSGGGFMDIVTNLAAGAQAQQQKTGGGDLMDLIKGFIK